jgi:hypothetical protein
MSLLKYVTIVWLCFLSLSSVVAQSPRFYIQSDRSAVVEGETFVFEAVLENIDSKTIEMPDVSPFKVVQGPSTSTSISIINGKRTGTISYQYILLATKIGKYNIPPATTKVGSKVIKSNALTIQVESAASVAKDKNIDAKGETFVRLEISDSKAFIGQQITLNYVLYTRQNIESYNIINETDLEGFYVQPLNDIRDQPQRRTVNGKEYYTQVIKRQILFPQKTGNYTIGPVNISLDIPVENGRSSFFFRETKKENVSTNSLKLSVNDLPKVAPISFSGGVGSFDMKASVTAATVNVGEAITLKMQIEGNGDPKIIKAPDFTIPNGLEKYEPTITKDETNVVGDKIMVLKVFEYIFVPSKDTVYTIEPTFSYLSTTSNSYETIKAGPFNINVTKGNGSIETSKDDDTEDVSNLISKDKNLYSLTQSPWMSFWHIGGLLFITLLTFVGILFKRKNITQAKVAAVNQSKAISIAKQNLLQANQFMTENNFKAFYEEIAKATTGYILKKFSIPNADASVINIVNILNHHQISQNVIAKYQEIQRQCELARFAGQYGNMTALYNDAEWIIDAIENKEIAQLTTT